MASASEAAEDAPPPPSPSLDALPDELLSRVLHPLPLVSRMRACAVSRRFKRLLATPALCAELHPAFVLLGGMRSLGVRGAIGSADGRFLLLYQEDANLVLYFCRPGRVPASRTDCIQPVWALQTVGAPYHLHRAGRLELRANGVIVARDIHDLTYWTSLTDAAAVPPCRLVVRNDGDCVVLDANDAIVWAAVPDARPGDA